MLCKIVSGGQTGVDRAALDAAIALGIPHGGWCPKGRRAEDGVLDDRYHLTETESRNYALRTIRNVLDSDATLILHRGPLTHGTRLTAQAAQQHAKPLYLVSLSHSPEVERIHGWLESHGVEVLNVAGPRESTCPGIYEESLAVLLRVLGAYATRRRPGR